VITFTLASSSSSSSNSSLSSGLFPTWNIGPPNDSSPFRFSYRHFSEITNNEMQSEPVASTSTSVKKSSKKKFKKRVRSFFGKLFKD